MSHQATGKRLRFGRGQGLISRINAGDNANVRQTELQAQAAPGETASDRPPPQSHIPQSDALDPAAVRRMVESWTGRFSRRCPQKTGTGWSPGWDGGPTAGMR